MPRFDAVIFDKDGTLFDFQSTWANWCLRLIEDEAAADERLRDRLAEVLGFDIAQRQFRPDSIVIAETTATIGAQLSLVLSDTSLPALIARMNAGAAEVPQVEAAPLVPLIGGLRAAGLCLGVATNDCEGPARAHLTAARVIELFDFVAGADSGHGAKPEPGQLIAFAEAVAVAPGRVAMIGDSRHDLIAARAAGMAAVGVLTGPASAADLAPHADVVLPSIAELPGWLGL